MVFAFVNVYNVLESDNLYPGCAGLQIYCSCHEAFEDKNIVFFRIDRINTF